MRLGEGGEIEPGGKGELAGEEQGAREDKENEAAPDKERTSEAGVVSSGVR
jgi:hypothetical protein